jgi:hypothetical protein
MRDLPVLLAIAGFAVMGVGAIAKPAFVTAQFGIVEFTRAGRNEVRAVYGGCGRSHCDMVYPSWLLAGTSIP